MRIPARFKNLDEIKKLFPKDFPVVGVGVTAWPRAALAYLLPNFSILSYLETSDLGAIRQVCPVVSMEKDIGGIKIERENTSTMLEEKKVQSWLGSRKNSGLFVYKGTIRIDKIVEKLGLKLMSTAGVIRNPLENKRIFREELIKAGVKPIQGLTLKCRDMDEKKWEECRLKLAGKLVFQLADSVNGGGAGTFFVSNKQDFNKFKEIVKEKELKKDKDLEWVNVTKFIEGETASIIGCATRHGVVFGQLQKQIIDQPILGKINGRAGVWQGHDWNAGFSREAQQEAENLAKTWGEHIYKQGYKGIFGLDVMVDNNNRVYPVECNARYTGAFPTLTMMQLQAGLMPFDVWHLAEWFDLDYEMDLDQVNKLYAGAPASTSTSLGGQLVMHSLEENEAKVTKTMKAGVYQFALPGPIQYVRPGFSLLDLKSKDEFVLADRVVEKGTVINPRSRLGRLVFKRPVIDNNGRLLGEIKEVVRQVYNGFGLIPEGIDKNS